MRLSTPTKKIQVRAHQQFGFSLCKVLNSLILHQYTHPTFLSIPFPNPSNIYALVSLGAIISSGRTCLSKSSEEMTLSSMAACLSVSPFLCACFAVLEAAS